MEKPTSNHIDEGELNDELDELVGRAREGITDNITLKKPEILRDPEGRFEKHGKSLSKTQKKKKTPNQVGLNKGKIIGRPKGSLNKTTLALKEAILAALDKVGGPDYLATLAIENSSAFAGLLGKVLPSTLAMPESNGGVREKVTFERVIVWPDGHREIEGVTPKQLTPPKEDDPNKTS